MSTYSTSASIAFTPQTQQMMDLPTNRSLDPFARLPSELCAMILSLLPDEDLITASHVSSFLRSQCLDDSLYAPLVKPRLEGLLQNTTSFSGDISGYTPTEIKELVCKLPSMSGTSYFDNIDSIREFFFRQHFLRKSWNSGRPPKVTKLRSSHGHRHPIDGLVIDPVFNQVISADCGGLICFWDVETGTIIKALRLQPISNMVWENVGGLVVLKDDVLLFRIHASRSIHICIRDPPSVPVDTRGFTPIASFSVADPVHSLLLEGSVCILGCLSGAVEFWDLRKEEQQSQSDEIRVSITPRKLKRITQQGLSINRNSTLYYRRPCLLLSSIDVVRVSPRNKDDNCLLDLWDHPAEDMVWEVYIHVIIHDDLLRLVPLKSITISPIGRSGSVLLAFPNSSVFRIDRFWDIVGHTVEGLVLSGPKESRLGGFAATDGYFLTTHTQGHSEWHKQPKTETIVCLYHGNGDPIAEYVGYSPISQTVMDPCFFISVVHDWQSCIIITDFRPQRGPSNRFKEVDTSNAAKRQRASKEEGEREDISPTPSLLKRKVKKKTSKPSSRKTVRAPNRGSAEANNTPEDSFFSSTESAGAGTQAASKSAGVGSGLPQRAVISWGEAAIQALNGHPGSRGGMSASEILGLVIWDGLREIMVGEEEDAFKEVGEALSSASQSSKAPVERVIASSGAEPRYRVSRSRGG